MSTKPIVIEAEEVQKIGITLVGIKYTITPPKAALAMKLATSASTSDDPSAVIGVLNSWVVAAFGKIEAKKVMARLDDPDDLLDIQHISSLMEKVIEAQTGNPTS